MLAAPPIEGPPESKKPPTNFGLSSPSLSAWPVADSGQIRIACPQTLMAA
jgi:hypothetical protein